MYKNIKELISKKKHDEAIFLGCGPSINELTPAAWQKIDNLDVWASNNWFVHDLIPDFHHLEVKLHRNGDFAKKMVELKKDEYKDVNWILDSTRPYLFEPDERPSTAPHTTLKTAKFIKEFGAHNNINFVNLSKKSELRNYIPTEEW